MGFHESLFPYRPVTTYDTLLSDLSAGNLGEGNRERERAQASLFRTLVDVAKLYLAYATTEFAEFRVGQAVFLLA